MKIGIIGAGFTGLAAGYYLQKNGHSVTIFEKDLKPGGLAVGFSVDKWQWTLEKHYHHFFTNDDSILHLAQEINFPIITKRPKTSVYVNDRIYQMDSPLKVLQFPLLSPYERFRMAATLGILRYNQFWKLYESKNAAKELPRMMGQKPYKLIWEPQLRGKYGNYADTVSLAWFWARIKKRTSSLAYPEGGFLQLAEAIAHNIEKLGGEIHYNTDVTEIKSNNTPSITLQRTKKQTISFDAVLTTLPSIPFLKIAPTLPHKYKQSLSRLEGIGAINLVLRLRKEFFKDGTYWLSVCDPSSPLMALVEHTQFMNKRFYNNEHLLYAGKYVAPNHPYFQLSERELLQEYDPVLSKINPAYKKSLIDIHIFKAPFAQPIIPPNYSSIIPSHKTPLKKVYLGNIQQVYPWDRGTNYAVEMGEKVARLIENEA